MVEVGRAVGRRKARAVAVSQGRRSR
jgi:hypothetical protein